jgi:hypothetical protein
VVLETAGKNTELAGYCRERGLYPEQLYRWKSGPRCQYTAAADNEGPKGRPEEALGGPACNADEQDPFPLLICQAEKFRDGCLYCGPCRPNQPQTAASSAAV